MAQSAGSVRPPTPPSMIEAAQLLARIGSGVLGDYCGVLLLVDGVLVPVALHDHDPVALERAQGLLEPFSFDRHAILRDVVTRGEPVTGSVSRDDLETLAFLEGIGIHAYLIVPLRAAPGGPVIGVVVFARFRPDRSRYYREHVDVARELVELVGRLFRT